MNMDTIRKMLSTGEFQGLAHGTMQVRSGGDEWNDGKHYGFNHKYEFYQFRPTPKPPKKVLRPFTADELIKIHREGWLFCPSKKFEPVFYPLVAIRENAVDVAGGRVTFDRLLSHYVRTIDGVTFLPCGVEVDQTEGGE